MFSVVSSGERDQTGQDAGVFFCLFVCVCLVVFRDWGQGEEGERQVGKA